MSSAGKVRRNFSRGARTYEESSRFQDKAAMRLVSLISSSFAERAGEPFKILELGCGTGMLSRRILETFSTASLLATDISPEMLSLCLESCSSAGFAKRLEIKAHDFNSSSPALEGSFDIVVSALAFQWGEDLNSTLRVAKGFLRPSGSLFFSIPLASSLEGVASVFSSAGVEFPGLRLPDADGLRASLRGLFHEAAVELASFYEPPSRLSEFLRRLRLSGTVNAGAPVPVGQLRRVLRLFGSSEVTPSYHVAFCRCK